MPVVPMVDQNVQQQAYDVPTPRFAQPVEKAYTGMADANVEAAGKVNQIVQGAADKELQLNLWNEQAKVYDAREKLSNDVTDLMTNSEMQTITDADGKQHEIPIGISSRIGYAAQGSGAEFKAKFEAKRNEYLDQFKIPQVRKQAERMFDSLGASGYRMAANH